MLTAGKNGKKGKEGERDILYPPVNVALITGLFTPSAIPKCPTFVMSTSNDNFGCAKAATVTLAVSALRSKFGSKTLPLNPVAALWDG